MNSENRHSETPPPSRLEELHVDGAQRQLSHNYTRFVKLMRYALPFAAVALIVVVITWPDMDDKIVVMQKEDVLPNAQNDIGENELLNPRFETTDAQAQPVNVTAIRALQNQENPNLVKLDQPNADLKMKDGSAIHIQALNGTYEQDTEKLFLQDQVKIKHESGYELQAEEMRIDIKTRQAFSDKDVTINGPDADIEAKGLDGYMDDGILTFKGPAKLTLRPKQPTPEIAPEEEPEKEIQKEANDE